MIKLIVTDRQLDYKGSITIGRKLLDGLLDGEKVTIHCLNGEQFDTYVIAGDKGVREKLDELELNFMEGSYDICAIKDGHTHLMPTGIDKILDLCEEGVCVNGAAARLVQVGDWIEVTNKETE